METLTYIVGATVLLIFGGLLVKIGCETYASEKEAADERSARNRKLTGTALCVAGLLLIGSILSQGGSDDCRTGWDSRGSYSDC